MTRTSSPEGRAIMRALFNPDRTTDQPTAAPDSNGDRAREAVRRLFANTSNDNTRSTR